MIYNRILSKFLKLQRNICTSAFRKGSCHLEYSPNSKLNKAILDRYMCLPIPECKVQVMYIWIDGTGEYMRCKTKTFNYIPKCPKDCPLWTYDGSSTYQAFGETSDLFLTPVALYNDPIRRGNNKLLLCETHMADHTPTKTNFRAQCLALVNRVAEHEPMFAFEQEYQMIDADQRPYGWPIMMGEPPPEGPYYCGIGAERVFGRDIIEGHYRACLYAGIDIFNSNPEITLSNWEFQIGTNEGIKAADDLWMARFLLTRIAEDYGIGIMLNPKMLPHWNGAGCNVNFSTKEMREDGGMKEIEKAICKLEKKHMEHLKMYDTKGGADNLRRLVARSRSGTVEEFTSGVGDRLASIRIPKKVVDRGKGNLEDRRPAANSDPYAVMYMILKTVTEDH